MSTDSSNPAEGEARSCAVHAMHCIRRGLYTGVTTEPNTHHSSLAMDLSTVQLLIKGASTFSMFSRKRAPLGNVPGAAAP